eukprot:7811197-Alexandrium_andersonii.AAC.1
MQGRCSAAQRGRRPNRATQRWRPPWPASWCEQDPKWQPERARPTGGPSARPGVRDLRRPAMRGGNQ